MKQVECARCGAWMMVPDDFDPYEDMAVCPDCDDELAGQYHGRLLEDTEPL